MAKFLPYQQRVVKEADELQVKLADLVAFGETPVFAALDPKEQRLLETQSAHMGEYLHVLQERIRGFRGMKRYTCHRQVCAHPMTHGDYNKLRGWPTPEGQDPKDEGYLVEYIDGGKPNHPDYANYISWSPKGIFDAGYKEKK